MFRTMVRITVHVRCDDDKNSVIPQVFNSISVGPFFLGRVSGFARLV